MEGRREPRASRRIAALVAMGLMLVPAASAHAQAGLPDPTFGTGGFTVLDEPSMLNEELLDVTALGNGQILGVGRRGTAGGFLVARFNANGTPDGGFGSAGIQVQPDTGLAGAPRSINRLDVQPDGRIVVAGLGRGAASNAFGFGRYMPDGTPDPSFGDGGIKMVEVGGGSASDVAVAPNGSIYGVGDGGADVLTIVRLTPAGQPDPGFGVGGVRMLDIPGSSNELATAIEVLGDGSVLIAGRQQAAGFVAKLDAAGNPVAGFGTNGFFASQFGATAMFAFVDDIVVQSDGSIVAVGASGVSAGDQQLFAARLTSAGGLDPSFASGGLFLANPTLQEDGGNAVELVDGRVLVAGLRGNDEFLNTGQTWLLRLTEGGALDPTFGQGGESVSDVVPGFEGAFGLGLQPDGKPLIAGTAVSATALQLLAGRYTADDRCKGKLPTAIGTAGRNTITGTAGPDVVVSLAGNDKVITGKGNDLVCGGRGKDKESGGPGKDHLLGEAGNDTANGGKGKDRIEGGRGKDKLKGGPGRDKLVGGAGNDRLLGGKGKGDRCIGGGGKHDTAAGCERIKRVP